MCYRNCLTLVILFAAGCLSIRAQTHTPKPSETPTAQTQKSEPTVFGPEFKRWFEIEAWTLSTRYRYIRTNAGVVTNNQQQWQMQFRSRFKFDAKAKYGVVAFVSSGNVFNGGWNNTGIGTGDFQTNLYVKQLYFNARPNKKVEVQFGGIDINRGENTEITTWDNDGYITGERLIVRHPKALWFDEISATNGYLGDTSHPSIFGRLHRLNESNYHQLLVRKQATREIGVSADYTFWGGADFLHEAVRAKPRNFLFTTLLFEVYQRVSEPGGYGFDAFAERVINRKFTVNGGFARVDRFLILNADRFPPGKRVYGSAFFRPSKEFTFQSIIIQGLGELPVPSTHRTRFEIILTWNVVEALHRHHIF
jgi:hypothetical protein